MAKRGLMGRQAEGGTARESGSRQAHRDSLWLTLGYAAASTAWVLFSDRALVALALNRELELWISSTKGVVFVLVTSAILYFISVARLTQLYTSRARASRLFHQAGEGMLAIEVELDDRGALSDLVVRDVNAVSAERFAKDREDLLGARRSDFDHADGRLRAYFELVAQGVESGEVVRSEVEVGDGAYELATAYPIEAELWAVAAMDVTALRDAQLQLRRQEERIRQAYVDVLDAVTGGKLVVMSNLEIAEELGEPLTDNIRLGSPEQLAEARRNIRAAIASRAPALSESTELVSAVGEALNNALKHANGGEYRVFHRDGRVQVCVSDAGPGIDFRTLPKATLVPGFSTASTLGMGFTIMLQLSTRVLLSTRPGQTSVVLEMDAE